MRISDWSSDVCSSDLFCVVRLCLQPPHWLRRPLVVRSCGLFRIGRLFMRSCSQGMGTVAGAGHSVRDGRSEEHTSELQSLMRISYAVFCLKKKKTHK